MKIVIGGLAKMNETIVINYTLYKTRYVFIIVNKLINTQTIE